MKALKAVVLFLALISKTRLQSNTVLNVEGWICQAVSIRKYMKPGNPMSLNFQCSKFDRWQSIHYLL